MPFNVVRRKQNALKQMRGTHGRFTSADAVSQKLPTNEGFFGGLLSSKEDDDDTLVNIKVKNPLHRIIALLQDIKSKQSTTVAFRFTIPLIALPIIILSAFQLGRLQSSCPTITTSKIGTIKNISVRIPENPGVLESLQRLIPHIPQLEKPSQLRDESRTVLVEADKTQTTAIIHPANLSLVSFENQQVLLTGTYSSCTSSMTLDALENIRLY